MGHALGQKTMAEKPARACTGPAMRPCSSDFSSSVEATSISGPASEAIGLVPQTPKVTGRRASSRREAWHRRLSRTRCCPKRRGACTEYRGEFLPRNVQVTTFFASGPPHGGRRLESTPNWARPDWLATGFPNGLERHV